MAGGDAVWNVILALQKLANQTSKAKALLRVVGRTSPTDSHLDGAADLARKGKSLEDLETVRQRRARHRRRGQSVRVRTETVRPGLPGSGAGRDHNKQGGGGRGREAHAFYFEVASARAQRGGGARARRGARTAELSGVGKGEDDADTAGGEA